MRYLRIVLVSLVALCLYGGNIYANSPRLALLIGNANYAEFSKLSNPVNDATEMAKALKQLGFTVILRTDVDNRTMVQAVQEFGQQLAHQGGIGLFYFSGHGVQYKQANYLIPLKTNIQSDADIEFETLNAGRVLEYMEQANNEVNIVILDACREVASFGNAKGSGEGLARMDSPPGTVIAYATAPNKTALGKNNERNSLYTKHLLAKLQSMPHASITNLLTEVTGSVFKESDGEQAPWQDASLTQQFCFAPCESSRRETRSVSNVSSEIPFQTGQIWRGVYRCSHGTSSVDIIIKRVESLSNTTFVYTVFDYTTPNGHTSGAYNISGKYNPNTRTLTLDQIGKWIRHPFLHWPLGFKGVVSSDNVIFSGNVLNVKSGGIQSKCAGFETHLVQ